MFEIDDEGKENPIGSVLRYHRELRKLDLDFVAEQLKIRKDYLLEMEQDRFDLLPEGMYRRSFLRAYADFLKLDADHILKIFNEQHKEEEEDPLEARSAWMKAHPAEGSGESSVPKERFSFQRVVYFLKFPFRLSTSGLFFLIFVAIIIVLACVLLLFKSGAKDEQNASTMRETSERKILTESSEPADTLQLFWQMVDDSIARTPEWTLRVSAIGECWMNLDSDGKRLFSGMVFEKMNLEFKAKDSFTINAGKNQGLKIWLNGFELKPLPSGVNNLTRENFKEFISTEGANRKVRHNE
jgi:transcriptional regulator with XRE-family HTH domain